MNCTHCNSKTTYNRQCTTNLGYQEYRCRQCNEHTGTVFNYLEYPTDVVILAVRYYHEFKTSLDDVVKLMAMRGFKLCHQTVRNWVQAVGIELALQFRARRVGQAGKKWHAEPTYIKVEGRWCYLYRGIDKEGNLVDVYLGNTRDNEAANVFFQPCFDTTCVLPDQITADKKRALANGINHTFRGAVDIRDNKFMNNRLEQAHRGIKAWYRNLRVFKSLFSALVLCTVFEEFRQHFKMKGQTRAQRRALLASKFYEFNQVVQLIT